jgi:DNA-binding beta-propeller fold protein YncE
MAFDLRIDSAEMAEKLLAILAAGNEWDCEQCTFLNDSIRSRCEMCDSSKPTAKAELPEAIEPLTGKPTEVSLDLEPPSTIPASALGADGTTYDLGLLQLTDSIYSVKQVLAAKSGMKVSAQQFFVMDDKREDEDLELKTHEYVAQALDYSASETTLQLVVVQIGEVEALEFMAGLSTTADWAHERIQEGPIGVSFVRDYPQLIVCGNVDAHTITVTNIHTGTTLCEYPRGGHGNRSTQQQKSFESMHRQHRLDYPYAIAFAEDGVHLVVCENQGSRLQVLKLVVGDSADLPLPVEGGLTVRLEFVRTIGDSRVTEKNARLVSPRGIAIRKVGEQERVLVADALHHAVFEYDINTGNMISKYGHGQGQEGCDDGVFNQPWDVAVLPSGGFVVVEKNNNRLQVFDVTGKLTCALEEEGMDVHPLRGPIAVTADAHGNLIVAEERGGQLRVFSTSEDGQLSSRMSSTVSDVSSGQKALAWDGTSSGRLAVADRKGIKIWEPGAS